VPMEFLVGQGTGVALRPLSTGFEAWNVGRANIIDRSLNTSVKDDRSEYGHRYDRQNQREYYQLLDSHLVAERAAFAASLGSVGRLTLHRVL
jgi:hypothetical protein